MVDARKAGFMTQPPSNAVFEGRAPGCNGKGIVELFMFKPVVGRYILHEWAVVNMPRAAQSVIQFMITIFSSVKTYRSKCGYPGKNAALDTTWRAGWSSQMDELFGLVENVMFDVIFDGALKDAVKRGQTPEEFVHGAEFSEATERVKNLGEADNNDACEEEDVGDEVDATGDVTNSKKGTCKQETNEDDEDMDDREEFDCISIAQKKFDKAVIRLVDSHIVLIADKGGSDLALAQKVAETAACKYSAASQGMAGKAYTLLNLDPSNIGESTAHPHLRKPPCNQDLVNRYVTVGLMARSLCEEGTASTEKIMPCDCWALFEGGRTIEHMLMKGFKGAKDGKMIKKSKFVLTINFDEESITANIGRATQMGSISCTDRCIITTHEDFVIPRRNRRHYPGTTVFKFQVFHAP